MCTIQCHLGSTGSVSALNDSPNMKEGLIIAFQQTALFISVKRMVDSFAQILPAYNKDPTTNHSSCLARDTPVCPLMFSSVKYAMM